MHAKIQLYVQSFVIQFVHVYIVKGGTVVEYCHGITSIKENLKKICETDYRQHETDFKDVDEEKGAKQGDGGEKKY